MSKTPKTKRISQGIHWCFTYNNYDVERLERLADTFKKYCRGFVFQEETGESGTKHLQGYIAFQKRRRPSELKLDPKIHWEKCRNPAASIEYCQKEETRTGKRILWNVKRKVEIRIIKDLYPWQKDVEEIVKGEPDARKLYWIWEPEGNTGKTEMCRYLVVKHNALILAGKAADMKFGIMKHLKNNNLDVLVFDVPRTMEKYLSYSGVEEAKNGIFFSSKYESGMVNYNPPHVFIFSNFYPDVGKFSADRWVICTIDSDKKLIKQNL